jgi:hypothetical protein
VSLAVVFFAAVSGIIFLTDSGKRPGGNQKTALFRLAPLAKKAPYKVLSRKNFVYNSIFRIQFNVEVPEETSTQQYMAIAQKLVQDTIRMEKCHSIEILFEDNCYVDFAPYGEWDRAGEIPINDYRDYKFKYTFLETETGYPTKPLIR